ncbi:MAG: apolipoprotein N-acyltransferase [Gammaproteobacteria bacterium]|nr:apolipoprotein N-acyltransferase [Gammaproteobacteria bacterium]
MQALFANRFAPLIAIATGALIPLSLAPFDVPALDLLSVALLFVLVWNNPARAGRLGWWFGVGKYGLGASWIYVSIHTYGPAPPWLAGSLVAVFVAALALFPAALTATYAWLRRRFAATSGLLGGALTFAACWVALEWILTWILTGFPWLYLGYAHLADPLRHLAPVGGVLLVSLAAAISGAALVAVVFDEGRRRVIAAGVAVLPWVIGAGLSVIDWAEPTGTQRVALVQGNIPQDQKWLRDNLVPTLDRYTKLTAGHWDTRLVIWPEAAIPLFEHQAQTFLEQTAARARAHDATLILGIPAVEVHPHDEVDFLNTAIAIGGGSGRYVKRRLVPFGEYVPLEDLLRGAISFFDLPMSHAVPGAWEQPLLVAGDLSFALAICYEVVYPDLVRVGAADADALVTLSNDAWFGHSIGPHQICRWRACVRSKTAAGCCGPPTMVSPRSWTPRAV